MFAQQKPGWMNSEIYESWLKTHFLLILIDIYKFKLPSFSF